MTAQTETMPANLDLQIKAEVIELATLFGVLPKIPGFKWQQEDEFLNIRTKPSTLLKLLGIDPVMNVVVGHPDLDTFTCDYTYALVYQGAGGRIYRVTQVVEIVGYTEGYNDGWYFLIKGAKGEEEKHRLGEDYFCCNAIVVRHNNNPEEGRKKIYNFLELAAQNARP